MLFRIALRASLHSAVRQNEDGELFYSETLVPTYQTTRCHTQNEDEVCWDDEW
jgi:hypothetical protein